MKEMEEEPSKITQITIPSVQLLELLIQQQLETVVMNKPKGICHTRRLAVLAVLDRPSEIPLPNRYSSC